MIVVIVHFLKDFERKSEGLGGGTQGQTDSLLSRVPDTALSQDHDRSRNTLNQLSHPGASIHFYFQYFLYPVS